jgi:acetyl esterase
MASLQGAIEEQRKVMDEGAALRDAHFSDLDSLQTEVEVAHHELGVTDGKIAIRRYWRKDSSAPAPAAVFYHGGGWIMGSLPADDIFCRMIARDLGHVVLSVDYRLAPEHPYPTPVNDCYEAYVWVRMDHYCVCDEALT